MSGNPGGRPKLPEEIRAMKEAALERAIEILHDKIHDKTYMRELSPSDLNRILETAFDRFGLPKVQKDEHSFGMKLEDLLAASWVDPPQLQEPAIQNESSGKLIGIQGE